MRRRKRLFISLILLLILSPIFLYFLLRPAPTSRKEIFRGVFLTVEQLPTSEAGKGRMMVVEIHWNDPGIELVHRDFSWPVDPENDENPHFRLANADWALFANNAAIQINTCRYTPDGKLDSIPGKAVRSIETIVARGMLSHVHQHSYLMYWDTELNATLLNRKPPTVESLDKAQLAIGVQGVQVFDGLPRYNAMGNLNDRIDRTFIGFDPDKGVLYLLAFESANGRVMIDKAIEYGVKHGGQVDSGGGTSLLIGGGAKGVLPHTGIRNWRPLGPYLMIKADRL